jgi:hypothetical protein
LDDAAKAKKLVRNLARLNADWEGVGGSILEGLDEMLTVTRLRLPRELRRSLAYSNIIENVIGVARRMCRNVKPSASCSNRGGLLTFKQQRPFSEFQQRAGHLR